VVIDAPGHVKEQAVHDIKHAREFPITNSNVMVVASVRQVLAVERT